MKISVFVSNNRNNIILQIGQNYQMKNLYIYCLCLNNILESISKSAKTKFYKMFILYLLTS